MAITAKEETSGFPFEYDLRISARARHINLRVTPADGLIVTVPRRCPGTEVLAVLDEKCSWIERSLVWAETERRRLAAAPPVVIPSHIDLPAAGERWSVEIKPTDSRSARVSEPGFDRLRLSGRVFETAAATSALKRWLARRARLRLGCRLDFLARLHGFSYARLSIRNQKSLWASCSPDGDISLNLKLLFLEPRLADYVLLHELCHTVHLDHSRRFWRLVEQMLPDCHSLKAAMANAWEAVPAWTA